MAQAHAPEPFALSKHARAGGKFGMLLKQFKADEPMLPARHEAGEKPAMAEYQDARDLPAGFWVWQRPYWFVFRDGPDTTSEQRQWGPEAACGPPDTPGPGDSGSAWAMKTRDAKCEWLLVEYDAPVKLVSVEVHENFTPGALVSIEVLRPDGELVELWRGEAKPVADKGRVLKLDVPLGFVAERVLLRFDSEMVAGWNEIDAVGLKDDKGKMHWAKRAEASSTYADVAGDAAPPAGVILRPVPVLAPAPLRIEFERPALDLLLEAKRVPVLRPARLPLLAPAPLPVAVPAPGPVADGAAEQKLQERVAELEARVKALEEALVREKAKAGKQGK
jgi:hypothetical protein